MFMFDTGITQQEVNLMEGRIRALGLSQAYWSALVLRTFSGFRGFTRIQQNVDNATLKQRFDAALSVLGSRA